MQAIRTACHLQIASDEGKALVRSRAAGLDGEGGNQTRSPEVPAGQVSRSVGNARGASAVRMVATAEFHSPIH